MARDLTVFLFGEGYAPSAVTVQILLWYIVYFFLGCLLANILIACGKQVIDAWISLAQVVVNVGLNFILIPLYSYNGAAAATVVGCFVGMFLTGWYAVKNPEIGLSIPWKEISSVLRVNLAYLGVLLIFKYVFHFSLWPFLFLGVLTYGLLLFSFRMFRWTQIQDYLSHWQKGPVDAENS